VVSLLMVGKAIPPLAMETHRLIGEFRVVNKNRGNVETPATQPEVKVEDVKIEDVTFTQVEETPVVVDTANYVMLRHNNGGHPDGRASYTIPGVKGNMVIFPTLFLDGLFPPNLRLFTVTEAGDLVPVKLASPRPKVTDEAKAIAAALKLQEKADKAQAKLVEAAAKAAEKAEKEAKAVEAAKARIVAAQAARTATPAI
jgi:hypothetical protein